MKAGVEHRVPLSAQALDVLASARSLDDGSGLVFPSPLRKGQALSDMTLTKVLKVAGLHDRGDRTRHEDQLQDVDNGADRILPGRSARRPWRTNSAALWNRPMRGPTCSTADGYSCSSGPTT